MEERWIGVLDGSRGKEIPLGTRGRFVPETFPLYVWDLLGHSARNDALTRVGVLRRVLTNSFL